MKMQILSLQRAVAIGLLVAVLVSAEARRRRPAKTKPHFVDNKLKEELLNKTEVEREGKVFSLFNVIQFQNSPCTSTSSISGGGSGSTRRNGTCFTQSECTEKGGTASGNCAAGFGVCCVFFISESGDSVNQNCSYIRNPGFPSTYADTSGVSYTVNKMDDTVCSLRLDFESFTILGTGNTEEYVATPATSGGQCLDSFTVTATTGTNIPVVCGQNTGQHMYVDIGRGSSSSSTLSFSFDSTQTGNRQWEIKVTQVPCASYNAPDGCLQYHTGLTGRFTTFNFIPSNDNHLANQDYSVCIRQEAGFCCIQYSVCDDANSMSLSSKSGAAGANADVGQQDTQCSLDYIRIEGSQAVCNSYSQPLHNKYCGVFLTNVDKGAANIPICDCTSPFQVDIRTDDMTDINDATTANTAQSRGTCLTWQQIPCK